jgi:hypothetical protein
MCVIAAPERDMRRSAVNLPSPVSSRRSSTRLTRAPMFLRNGNVTLICQKPLPDEIAGGRYRRT